MDKAECRVVSYHGNQPDTSTNINTRMIRIIDYISIYIPVPILEWMDGMKKRGEDELKELN